MKTVIFNIDGTLYYFELEKKEKYILKSKDFIYNTLGQKVNLIYEGDLDDILQKAESDLKIGNYYKLKIEGIKPRKLFNPEGVDDLSERYLINGNSTGIFNLNNVKYLWTKSMYNIMIGNFWIPEKVKGLSEDKNQYELLSDSEKRAYDMIISFLTFLDSIQTMNLPNINDYITAPEVNLILSIHAFQEAIHSQSYATILESVLPVEKREQIYYYRRQDAILLERNKFIGKIYQDFILEPNINNFFKVLIGNYILEGLYFYNGFAFFDTLADNGKMLATQRMISYIRRDELTHVTVFVNLIKDFIKENPEIYNEKIIYDMFDEAVNREIKFSLHTIKNISGINESTINQYTKWLANKRLEAIGLNPLYPEINENPYKHLERLWDHNLEKGNFFESTVTNYTMASALKGSWDF